MFAGYGLMAESLCLLGAGLLAVADRRAASMIVLVLLAFGVLILLPVLPMLRRTSGFLARRSPARSRPSGSRSSCARWPCRETITRTGLALWAAMIEALCVALAAVLANFAESRARAAELRADR